MDTTTVGVDLAKNVFVACVADCAGRIVARQEFNRAMAKHVSDRRTGQTDQQTQLANEWLT